MADGKVIIETLLDASGIEKGLSIIKGAIASISFGLLTKDIIDVGSSFESTMTKVGAISGATESQLKDLEAAAKDMGKTSVFSASQAAEAMTYMGMAGWDSTEMIAGLPGIMNLAAASGEDLANVSDIVTDGLTAFGKSAGDSGRLADILAAAAVNANTNVGMLGESFKYVAPVAGALKYSMEDTTLALSLMANAGIKSSQAGTSLRTAISRMVSPTKNAKEQMDKLGISVTDSQGNMKPLVQVLEEMRGSFGNLSEAEQAEAASAIFGKEAMSGMLAVINASDKDFYDLKEAIDGSSEAFDGMGTAAGLADQMVQNFSGQMTLLGSALEGAKLAIWENLEQPLTNLAKVATDSVNTLVSAFEEGGVSGLASAATRMMLGFMGSITDSMPSITQKGAEMVYGLMAKVKETAPQLITSAFDLVASFVNGIASNLPTLIPQGVQMVLTVLESIVSNLPKLIDAGINLVKSIGQGIINALPDLISRVPALINGFFDAVWNGAGQLISAGLQFIVNLGKGIIQNIPLIISHAGEIVTAILNVLMAIDLWSAGKSIIGKLGKGIKEAVPEIKAAFKELATKAFEAFKNTNWFELGKSAVNLVKNGVSGAGSFVVNGLKTIGSGAMNAFKGVDWGGVGKGAIGLVKDGVSGAGKLVSDGLKTIGTNGLSAIKGVDWAGAGKSAVGFVKNGISGAASVATTAIKSVGTNAVNAFKNINWAGLGKNVINLLVNGVKGAANLVVTGLKTIGTNAVNAFKNISWSALGKNVINLLVSGIKGVASLVLNALKAAGTKALQGFKAISWSGLGKAVVQGIISGISGAAGSLFSSLKSLASRALSSAKSALGIKSPSKLFKEQVGRWIPEGVAVGIDENANVVVESIKDMTDDLVESSGDIGKEMADSIAASFKPDSKTLSEYYEQFMSMLNAFDGNIPAVRGAQMGISFDTVTRFREIATAMSDELKDSFGDLKEEVKRGIQEGMNNVDLKLDGRSVGKGMAPYINKYMTV